LKPPLRGNPDRPPSKNHGNISSLRLYAGGRNLEGRPAVRFHGGDRPGAHFNFRRWIGMARGKHRSGYGQSRCLCGKTPRAGFSRADRPRAESSTSGPCGGRLRLLLPPAQGHARRGPVHPGGENGEKRPGGPRFPGIEPLPGCHHPGCSHARDAGDTTLKHIMIRHPIPVLILSSFEGRSMESVFEFLQVGAVDISSKPREQDDPVEFGQRLRQKLRRVSRAG